MTRWKLSLGIFSEEVNSKNDVRWLFFGIGPDVPNVG